MQHEFFKNENISLLYDTNSKKWRIRNLERDTTYDLSDKNNLSPFLQIFKEDPKVLLTNLNQSIKDLGLREEILDALPIKGTILFCLKNKMFFWLDLSFRWLKFINIDIELRDALEQVVNDLKSPHDTRIRLMKILKDVSKST
jgi:hypothetical protein